MSSGRKSMNKVKRKRGKCKRKKKGERKLGNRE
jgi:hypothetical protein